MSWNAFLEYPDSLHTPRSHSFRETTSARNKTWRERNSFLEVPMTTEITRAWETELAHLEAEQELDLASPRPGDLDAYLRRWRRILELQRKICEARKEEFAEPIEVDLPVGMEWHAVLGWSFATLLVDLDHPVAGHPCAAITFEHVFGSRMESLNDEVFETHPFYGKGLDLAGVFVINNSTWKSAVQKCMSDHPCYDEGVWRGVKHFLFRDKEGDFHCLATGFSVKLLDIDRMQLRAGMAFWR
jgi:hypothetical protein